MLVCMWLNFDVHVLFNSGFYIRIGFCVFSAFYYLSDSWLLYYCCLCEQISSRLKSKWFRTWASSNLFQTLVPTIWVLIHPTNNEIGNDILSKGQNTTSSSNGLVWLAVPTLQTIEKTLNIVWTSLCI